MNIFRAFFAALGTLWFVFCLGISSASADTHVTDGILLQNASWDRQGSPYILDSDILVASGATLHIGQGVEVRAGSSTDDADFVPTIAVDSGSLVISGTSGERVSVHGLGGVSVRNGSADIANADFTGYDGISFDASRGRIATTTLQGGFSGIVTKDSEVRVWGSKISNVSSAVWVIPHHIISIGGIGNALDGEAYGGEMSPSAAIAQAVPLASSSLIISGSSITDNSAYAVDNLSDIVVQAGGNWWGNAGGPVSAGANRIFGPVSYDPWLASEPPLDQGTAPAACCSSILFIPGLEATRLYRDQKRPLIGATTDRLWEPLRDADVAKLFLDQNGSSTDPAVYSGDPIAKALGLFGIYSDFMDFLDGLVKKGSAGEWRSFGYDWREPVAEVVAGKEKKATTTESLLKVAADLAARSKTGKISIIAHSNGGLVAKALVKALSDRGVAGIVDTVISVAVPYLGTPQADLALLHGYGQSLAAGLILRKSTARQMGENMASAYSLLPSRAYFEKVLGPVVTFATNTAATINNGAYQDIRTFDSQASFISDSKHGRKKPSDSDVSLPLVGNKLLLSAADAIHGVLDPFSWPSTISRWAIAGWGIDTPKALAYSDAGYSAETTRLGDGTVVVPSAAYNDGTVVAVELGKASAVEDRSLTHPNILESKAVQSVIETALQHSSTDMSVRSSLDAIPGVSIGEPDASDANDLDRTLVVSTHRLVDPVIYDSHGRRTGETIIPAEADDGLYSGYETGIPGSSFRQEGTDDSPVTYIALPDDGQAYKLLLNGTGSGTFTLDVERRKSGVVVDRAEYADVPVTAATIASTMILSGASAVPDPSGAPAAPPPSLASSTQPLQVDIDGNGVPDIQAKPNQPYDAISVLEGIKKSCLSLSDNAKRGKDLAKRIEKAEDQWRSGKIKRTVKIVSRVEKRIAHRNFKGMSASDKESILGDIDGFIRQFE